MHTTAFLAHRKEETRAAEISEKKGVFFLIKADGLEDVAKEGGLDGDANDKRGDGDEDVEDLLHGEGVEGLAEEGRDGLALAVGVGRVADVVDNLEVLVLEHGGLGVRERVKACNSI